MSRLDLCASGAARIRGALLAQEHHTAGIHKFLLHLRHRADRSKVIRFANANFHFIKPCHNGAGTVFYAHPDMLARLKTILVFGPNDWPRSDEKRLTNDPSRKSRANRAEHIRAAHFDTSMRKNPWITVP